jgi:uncharacterized Zn-finger protein
METIACIPCSKPVKIGERKPHQGKIHFVVEDECGDKKCEYCPKTFKNTSTLSMHISRKHAAEAGRQIEPYACGQCEERFTSSSARLHHIANHHEISYTKCPHPTCKYEGKNKQSIFTHFVKKHMDRNSMRVEIVVGVESKCLTCEKVMKESAIAYHLATCNRESPFCKMV